MTTELIKVNFFMILVFRLITGSKNFVINKQHNNSDLAFLFTDFNKKLSDKIKTIDFNNITAGLDNNFIDAAIVRENNNLPLHEDEDKVETFKGGNKKISKVNKKYLTKFINISENEYMSKDNIYAYINKQDLSKNPFNNGNSDLIPVEDTISNRFNNIEEKDKPPTKKQRKESNRSASVDSMDIPDII
jgi:hypothetical protein